MFRVFVTIAIIGLLQSSRANGFRFLISKLLNNTNALDKENWCFVEVIENENVSIKVEIPLKTSYSGVSVYFANENKEILQISLKDTIQGEYYETPYKLIKEMKGEKTEKTETENFHQITGQFPLDWLPNNCSKISATVECDDERILNYYGIQNLKISLPDLMILEEFKNYKSN